MPATVTVKKYRNSRRNTETVTVSTAMATWYDGAVIVWADGTADLVLAAA